MGMGVRRTRAESGVVGGPRGEEGVRAGLAVRFEERVVRAGRGSAAKASQRGPWERFGARIRDGTHLARGRKMFHAVGSRGRKCLNVSDSRAVE